MARYIYVDNSNLFIEARRLAAVQAGLVGSMRQAQAVRALDNTYNLDYALLRDFLAEGHQVGRSVLFGSTAAGTGAVWEYAEAAGWEVFSFERNFKNKEKKIDIAVVTEMILDAFKRALRSQDQIVLVAGDSDYLPAVYRLKEEGFVVLVYFWSQAAAELKQVATEFICMDEFLANLELRHR
jgi:uncharacterized LabA/DUF88 family protein